MKFVGGYVEDVTKVLRASALSGHNVMTISQPGWGKSDMAKAASEVITGGDGSIFLELDPSTPPEVLRGAYDPAAMLNGRLERIVTNTCYDPKAKVVILDEVWRPNDIVFDILLHATNRKDIDPITRPVFWGTSNFVGTSARTEALRDRFALWLWIEPELDLEGVVDAHLNNGTGTDPAWAKQFPSWEDCIRVRRCHAGPRAIESIKDMLTVLTKEAAANKFVVNPRRIVQWSEMLFRVSCFASGTENFETISADASGLLRYAYPACKMEDSKKWAQVAMAVADSTGAMIDAYRSVLVEKFRKLSEKGASAQNDPSQKTKLISELGAVMSEAERELDKIGHADPRVKLMKEEINIWFQRAVTGKPFIES